MRIFVVATLPVKGERRKPHLISTETVLSQHETHRKECCLTSKSSGFAPISSLLQAVYVQCALFSERGDTKKVRRVEFIISTLEKFSCKYEDGLHPQPFPNQGRSQTIDTGLTNGEKSLIGQHHGHPSFYLAYFMLDVLFESILRDFLTYNVKKLKKMKFSKGEEAAGKAYAYAYFLMLVICFCAALRPDRGTDEMLPIVKDFALMYATWELVIELAVFCLLRVNRLDFKKILYAGAKSVGVNPVFLIFFRVLGVMLFIFYLLATVLKI